jgi:hypothetical protein
MQKKTYYLALTGMGLLFLWYLFRRAALLSMTHDESGTTDLAVIPLAEIMFSPKQFQTANNHILNSLLMKVSITILGYKEWAVRLPNVLSFVLYFSAAALLMQRLTPHYWLRLGGVLILCSAHYLLDFFSLARGYGMANAFGLCAVVALVLYSQEQKNKWLITSFVSAALACYANFTWMNLYLGLWTVLNLSLLVFPAGEPSLIQRILKANIPPLVIALLLAAVSYRPISFLRTKEEFKWGAQNWMDSFQTFLADWLYGQKLLFLNGATSKQLLTIVVPLFLLVILALLIRHRITRKNNSFLHLPAKAVFITTTLLLVIVAGTVLQKQLLNTFYIDGRKASLYMPLLLALAVSCISWLEIKNRKAGQIASVSMVVVTGLLLAASLNFYQCREWWYDANSKEVAYTLSEQVPAGASIAVTWQFHPSLTFYNRHQLNNPIQSVTKTTEISNPESFDFYYVMGDDIRNVPPLYKPVKRFFWDRVLLRKDNAWYQQQLTEEMNKLQESGTATAELEAKATQILLEKRRNLQWDQLFWKD